MQDVDLAALLEAAISLARQASQKILEIYDTDFNVDMKQDSSPLTAADMASHRCLTKGLGALEPTLPILSEEAGDISFEERKSWPLYWLIDPLDGTKEFIKRNGEFTVNIALIHEHRPLLGVVYVPVKEHCYYAAKGLGAYKKIHDEPAQAIRVRKRAPEKLAVVGSRSHNTGDLADYLRKLGEYQLISIGSSLKFCLVAEGKADLYPRIGPTSEWDTAAAHCVVEEAEGHVIDLHGNPLRYNTKESFLNPPFLVFGDDSRDWTQYARA